MIAHEVVYGNAHRTVLGAGTAEGAGKGHRLGVCIVVTYELGCEHETHGAGVDGPVTMSADMAIHGTDVEAGTTADAAHYGLELGIEQLVTPVIHDDVVNLGRTVQLALMARTGVHTEICRHLGTHSALGQQGHEDVEGLERGDDAIDADEDDLHRWEAIDHATVALVSDKRDRAGLRHRKVAAAYAHLGTQKLGTQHLA